VLTLTALCFAQGNFRPVTVNSGRPVADAILELERLSGKAINFEDVRYEHPADLADVTDRVMTPAQRALAGPFARVIVPRGGSLTVTIPVDAATQKLTDALLLQNAVNLLLAQQRSAALPGAYALRNSADRLFVEPAQVRASSGNAVPSPSVLLSPITLPLAERTALETLQLARYRWQRLREIASDSEPTVVRQARSWRTSLPPLPRSVALRSRRRKCRIAYCSTRNSGTTCSTCM
jgi:hypothetical protein